MQLQTMSAGWRMHPTAEVSDRAVIGADTLIWRNVHVREAAHVGRQCIIGAGVYIGAEVELGDRCKIQNDALLYEGLTLEDGVFVGPQVCFTNDYWPRAINADGSLKSSADWELGKTLVRHGASVGARSVIVTGVTIGAFAMVGAGSVVTRDVPEHALVFGSPARIGGWVCACGRKLSLPAYTARGWCTACDAWTALPALAAGVPNRSEQAGVAAATGRTPVRNGERSSGGRRHRKRVERSN